MEYFLFYCLFAVTTGLCALYELVAPIMRKRTEEYGYVDDKTLWYVTLFLSFTLFAPLVFLSCIIPELGIRFREVAYEAMFGDE